MLKNLENTELELILPWRNNPIVRRAMFTQNEISLAEHRSWYERIQNDQNKQWLLYYSDDNKPSGVVYFTDINTKQGTTFWGFYTSPEAIPGTGMRMSLEAIDYIFYDVGIYKLNAEALASNHRSLKMHSIVGFVEEGRFRAHHVSGKKYQDVIRLGILAKEWEVSRQKLILKLSEFEAKN